MTYYLKQVYKCGSKETIGFGMSKRNAEIRMNNYSKLFPHNKYVAETQ